MEVLAEFANLLADYIEQINQILACPRGSAGELTEAILAFEQVWGSMVTLPGVKYEPKFQV